jgi:acyl dehydratase
MTADTPVATRGLRYADVEVGDELPPLAIPLTRTLIVATAIASRDYQDVHHDPGLAQERGSPDIFMNILTTNGFVGRYVTDWAGPNAVFKAVKIRLGAPNYPGDTMTMTGSVIKKEDGIVDVAVKGSNELGDHVTGVVTIELADPPVRWSAGDEPVRGPGRERTEERKKHRALKRKKSKKKGKK